MRRLLARTARAVTVVAALAPLVVIVAVGWTPEPQPLGESPRAFAPAFACIEGRTACLGTDRQGRDFAAVLARGVLPSLAFAAAGTLAVLLGATAWGLVEGGVRRLRVAAGSVAVGLLALPDLIVLATVRGVWPKESAAVSLSTLDALANASVVATLAALTVPGAARVVAARVRYVAGSAFVRRTRGYGAGPAYLARRELLPHLSAELTWLAAGVLPRFVALEASLSFLGLGYRGVDGLGQVLVSCRQNATNAVASGQLLATTAVLVFACLWPRLALRAAGAGRPASLISAEDES